MADIHTKRVYDAAGAQDGRVLVDRVWPRGLKKEEVKADLCSRTAPTSALRKWFAHDPSRWEAFRSRYFDELDARSEAVARLLDSAREGRLTLLFSARDVEHNQAVALKSYLLERLRRN